MVDWYGHWTYREDDPQEKWCLYDYLARQIISSGYEPKTSLENLCNMILAHYDCELESEDVEYFAYKYSQDDFNTQVSDIVEYVNASGGYKEFDYEC
jgi:hypothetical protein